MTEQEYELMHSEEGKAIMVADIDVVEAYTQLELLIALPKGNKQYEYKRVVGHTSNDLREIYIPSEQLKITSPQGFPFYIGQVVGAFKIVKRLVH